MRTQNRLLSGSLALISLLLTLLVPTGSPLAFSSNPPDGVAGAPGENTCTQCHSTFPLNSGAGMIGVNGLMGTYAGEGSESIEIVLSDPDAARWGFEFTILDAAGNSVGTLSPADANTQVSTGGPFGRTYAKHTSAGTQTGTSSSASWFLNWDTPPVGTGALTLYVAANAANNNGGNSGDRIYADTFPLVEVSNTGVDEQPALASSFSNFPNPFNPKTTVGFNLAENAAVHVLVLDLRGRVVKTLHEGALDSGRHELIWDGRDEQGQPSASGVYFARLLDARGADLLPARKMMLLK